MQSHRSGWLPVVVGVLLLAAGCSPSSETAAESPSTTAATSTDVTRTSVTTTTAPLASTTTSPLRGDIVVPLASTPYEGPELAWERSGTTFDRSRNHWLGRVGEGFVLLSWDWVRGDFTAQTSPDGTTWTQPQAATGLETAETPTFGGEQREIDTGGAGLIMLLAPVWEGDTPSASVFTSVDGVAWNEEDLSALDGIPSAVAANDATFAVITDDAGPSVDPQRRLYIQGDNGAWDLVDTPDDRRNLWWVTGLEDRFVAKGAYETDELHDHEMYVVSEAAEVDSGRSPSDFRPISWGDRLLLDVEYGELRLADFFGQYPTLYVSSDVDSWGRLPFPHQEPEYSDDKWFVEFIAPGPEDLLIAGCAGCRGYWEFYGNSFGGVEIAKDGYMLEVWGDNVFVFQGGTPDIRDPSVDTAAWFDPRTGTLTVPDSSGGAGIVVTCDEMRSAVVDMGWPGDRGFELLEYPDEALWHSPNGTSWLDQNVRQVFGDDAYVLQSAVTATHATVLVAPSGERPVPDPLGCDLGLYPEERPFEIWSATLARGG